MIVHRAVSLVAGVALTLLGTAWLLVCFAMALGFAFGPSQGSERWLLAAGAGWMSVSGAGLAAVGLSGLGALRTAG